jgi:hypothetical protein
MLIGTLYTVRGTIVVLPDTPKVLAMREDICATSCLLPLPCCSTAVLRCAAAASASAAAAATACCLSAQCLA